MKLTNEQSAVVESSGDAKVNAVAGSGKTSTIVEYARKRKDSDILYLVYNKSARVEGRARFRKNGLNNVRVETAHSLAHQVVIGRNRHKYQLSNGYKLNELVDMLGIEKKRNGFFEFILASHVSKLTSFFCNNGTGEIDVNEYLEKLDAKSRAQIEPHIGIVVDKCQGFLTLMNNGEIGLTHDFYLKKFQLLNPVLEYDYILFDEGQDASGAMLDVFLNQKGCKVIVGDTHQQIYGWRYAVNSLDKVEFDSYHLSNSFRFSNEISDLANAILEFKERIGEGVDVPIKGIATANNQIQSQAVIGRSNLALLAEAIKFIAANSSSPIYFEGNLSSYTYAGDGASLYDVLNLSLGNYSRIRNQFIADIGSMDLLREYVDESGDFELAMMIDIVDVYGVDVFTFMRQLKEMQVDEINKDRAEMIFSTVHKSKGMEYDSVRLCNDFITMDKIEELMENNVFSSRLISNIREQVNIFYVAVTRAKNEIIIPEPILPKTICYDQKVIKRLNRESYVSH